MKTALTQARELAALIDLSSDDSEEFKRRLTYLAGKVCKAVDTGKIAITDPEAGLALIALLASAASYGMGSGFAVKAHPQHNTRQ